MKKLIVLVILCVLVVLIYRTLQETVDKAEIIAAQKPTYSEWGVVNRFGLVTTVWISKKH